MWSCLMCRHIGNRCAKLIGDQHEERGNKEEQPAEEAEMDYHNNYIGRRECRYAGVCEDLCTKALEEGRLVKIQKDNDD